MAGYHLREIRKGILGEFSKIKEEFDELTDAHEQDNKVLELCEFADLFGAIEAYTTNKYHLTIREILKMTDATNHAFQDGTRK